MRPLVEVCIEGVDDLLAAQQGGADRVELCASLLEGGITPSLGVVRQAVRLARVPVHVMVRPRGGDFLYSDVEFASMLEDVAVFRKSGVAGVVFGCLAPDGTVDETRTAALVKAARPLSTTFHRAFDMTPDPAAALEALIRCGCNRVLTSGQRPDAIAGTAILKGLVAQAGDRIIVLGCGELRPETIARVRCETGLAELHFAALVDQPSPMRYRNPAIAMGGSDAEREYRRTVTDADMVARTIRAAKDAQARI
jgi:copper homeostasis protein